MPLYVADYLADTAHLGALESGAYLHLIMHYWLKGSLPDDPVQLAKISRLSLKQFNRALPLLSPFFNPDWTHKRIDQELEKVKEISEKRRDAVSQRRDRSNTNVPTNVEQKNTHSHSHSHIQSESQSNIKSKSGFFYYKHEDTIRIWRYDTKRVPRNLLQTKTKVKKASEIVKWLEDNGYEVDLDGDWVNEKRTPIPSSRPLPFLPNPTLRSI
mgnify:CR=1 FL=1